MSGIYIFHFIPLPRKREISVLKIGGKNMKKGKRKEWERGEMRKRGEKEGKNQ